MHKGGILYCGKVVFIDKSGNMTNNGNMLWFQTLFETLHLISVITT